MDTNRERTQEKPFVSGMPSFCTANGVVIKACMEEAMRRGRPALFEATANQVNQFGGYTGMRPADYRDFVYAIAEEAGMPKERVILGGDHLGPLVWANEPEASAMEKAEELVGLYVTAGYRKIHLDTSMRLADDSRDLPLGDDVIARRGARLYLACERAYRELRRREEAAGRPEPGHPVFIIGSEVPIPGGAQEALDKMEITTPQALENTLRAYETAFSDMGVADGLDYIAGVVVQPGVEFGDDSVCLFDPRKAAALSDYAATLRGITLEGHSTDYQLPENLKSMVESGITILKVGPALTFALREALFGMEQIERRLIAKELQSRFSQRLEEAMLENPGNWEKHYHGDAGELRVKRAFSLSDRCRYYLDVPDIQRAIAVLLRNIDSAKIPMGMLHQYMPEQCAEIRRRRFAPTAENLAKSAVRRVAGQYYAAFSEASGREIGASGGSEAS